MLAQAVLECGSINALPQDILNPFLSLIEKTRKAPVLSGTSFFCNKQTKRRRLLVGIKKSCACRVLGHVLLFASGRRRDILAIG